MQLRPELSSLVRAGVVPAIEEGEGASGSSEWRTPRELSCMWGTISFPKCGLLLPFPYMWGSFTHLSLTGSPSFPDVGPPTTYGGALMIECPPLSPDMGGPFSFQKWDTPFLSPDVLLFLPVTQFGPYPPVNPLPTPQPSWDAKP